MAIVNATIKSEIDDLIANMIGGDPVNDDPEATKDKFSQGLADIIENAMKSIKITIPTGTIITVGSASTQTQSLDGVVVNGVS